MPRPERPLDPAGPLTEFAQMLRDLRGRTGMTYADMANETGVSKTVLSQAAAGRRLPTWEATRAYVTACGEQEHAWRARWEQAERQWRTSQPSTSTPSSTPPTRTDPPDSPTQRLARDLGRLRRAAGQNFRDLAEQVGRSPGELVAVVQGKAFPDWALTKGFVLACRGSLPQWRQRWEQAMRWRLRQHDGGNREQPRDNQDEQSQDGTDWTVRLATVSSRAEFAAALRHLRQRSGLTYGSIEELSGLPTSTISDMLGGRTLPSEATLNAFLKALGVSGRAVWRWMSARERVQMSRTVLPATATRVANVHARTLGLHTPVERHLEQPMPSYIPREVDQQLQQAIDRGSGGNGGFLLVTGGPAAGKTRSTFEAVSNTLPDWWLVRPYDAEQLASLAKAPDQNTVIWLDELQRYGTDDGFLHGLRTLLECDRTVLIIGIVRLEQYQRFLSGLDRGRELLDLDPDIVTVPQRLTQQEWLRARSTSLDDPRVEAALACHDHGTFQVLAAGPELVHRWKLASDRYGAALISVAVDARRLGVRAGLPAGLLREAAYGYLSRAERATDPSEWFDVALEYACTPLLSGVAALMPVASPDIQGGAPQHHGTGHIVADYLVQHDESLRPTVLPPDSAWDAFARHLDAGNDLDSLAVSAERLGLTEHAERLTHRASVAGHTQARHRLVERYEQNQRFDDAEALLRAVAENGCVSAQVELAELCERHGRFTEAERHLVAAVEHGAPRARQLLVRLLHRQMRIEELDAAVREAVGAGEPGSRFLLAYVLDAHGDTADAEQLLREAAGTDTVDTAWAHNELLRLSRRQPRPHRGSGARHEQSLAH